MRVVIGVTVSTVQGRLAVAGGLVAVVAFVTSRVEASRMQAQHVWVSVDTYPFRGPSDLT
jgi:hypothetical protein